MTTTSRPVRIRYAPSPTGPQHIGGIRTALFGWLYARHCGGHFILRIEDTDQKRSIEGSTQMIMGALHWVGIDWDEGPDKGGEYGPYIQSERLEHYQKWANWLVENGKAYKCFCTAKRLQRVNQERQEQGLSSGYDRHCRNLSSTEITQRENQALPYVIRFKTPMDGETIVSDMIRGNVQFENSTLQDIVLLKSDGFPTYHLAHIVDDHLMQISHITRAIEWLPSAPIHFQLWCAFGWETPQYAHLPVLLNPNGKGKLSKRTEAFVEGQRFVPVLAHDFISAGYLPEAVTNFLANIGWTFGDEREVFSIEEAIERFDLADVHPSNSAYPIEKLEWLNGIYIREMPVETLAQRLRPILENAGLEVNVKTLLKVTPVVQVRIKTLHDVIDMAGFFFRDYSEFQSPEPELLIQKKMDAATTKTALKTSYQLLEVQDDFSHENQYEIMKDLAKKLDLKNGQLFGAIRVAVTGQKVSTPTFETMEILGKEESLRRIKMAITALQNFIARLEK